ncbi:unnamed protein product [Phaeothamnion confervicola]
MLAGQFDEGRGFNAQEELARRQRQRMFQTGLLLCFLLLMLDYRTSPAPTTGTRGRASGAGGATRVPPPIASQSLEELKQVLAADAPPNISFPVNASGIYKGTWQKLEPTQVRTLIPQLLSDAETTAADAARRGTNATTTLDVAEGEVQFRLYSQPFEGAKDELSLIWGLGRIVAGRHYTAQDTPYNIQGVFFNQYGRLRAIASFRGSRVKLVWTKSGGGDTSPPGDHHPRRLAASDGRRLRDGSKGWTGAGSGGGSSDGFGFPGSGFAGCGRAGRTASSPRFSADQLSFEVTWPDGDTVVRIDPEGKIVRVPAATAERFTALNTAAAAMGVEWLLDDDTADASRSWWKAFAGRSRRLARQAAPPHTVPSLRGVAVAPQLLGVAAAAQPGAAAVSGAVLPTTTAVAAQQGEVAAADAAADVGAGSLTAGGGRNEGSGGNGADAAAPAAAAAAAAAAALLETELGVSVWPSEARQQEPQVGMQVPSIFDIKPRVESSHDCVFLLDLQAGPEGTAELRPAWVDVLHGEFVGVTCPLAMNVTVESNRIDWDVVFPKAVNYSVLLTVVCLMQIALLFKQLHYSPTQGE